MYFVLLPVAIVGVAALMAIGLSKRQYWALYLLNALWLLGLVVATYLTGLAWMDRAYSENWAMFGVIFYVWPYSVFVTLAGGIELVLLRGHTHPHARRCRLLTSFCIVTLVLLSVSALFLA